MIVCHCNVICDRQVGEAVSTIAGRDPHRVVTPGSVFGCCGKRPNCGGCMPLMVKVISQHRDRLAACAVARTVITGPQGVTRLEIYDGIAQTRGSRDSNPGTGPEADTSGPQFSLFPEENPPDEGQSPCHRISQSRFAP